MKADTQQAEQVISLDIGSTFTKAALFQVGSDTLNVSRFARVPTTPDDLMSGVYDVIQQLEALCPRTDRPAWPVYYSSSAKGGLHVAAVGIVPALTLKVARLTAASAGARVSRSYGYKLTAADLDQIDALHPDIILFSGGTDGGNESYVRHNARQLARLKRRPQIIYAGNRVLREEIATRLTDFSVHMVDNILPDLDTPCVEQARAKICEVFLETIVSGKGLDAVMDWLGPDLLPTPLAVMHLVEQMRLQQPGWGDFCAVDVGGATTDFYSSAVDAAERADVIYRGLVEPAVKRTVEGDLGIRTNAPSVMIAGSEYLQEAKSTSELRTFLDYIDTISRQTDRLPRTNRERSYDRMLAEICLSQALDRHAGVRKRTFTDQGRLFVQTGKDLTHVRKMILTGGFFSSLTVQELVSQPLNLLLTMPAASPDISLLVPQEVTYYQDHDYLMPLLGNLAVRFPVQACRTLVDKLILLPSAGHYPLESTC